MTNLTNINVLNDIVAVQLNFSIWTGRKKLNVEDLMLDGDAPPKEIVNLGSKYTTDPSSLNVFHKLKRRAERACASIGIPFLSGYAIPKNKVDDLSTTLDEIMAELDTAKKEYLENHESIQKAWVDRFPKYQEILETALTSVTEVERKIRGSYSMFQINIDATQVGLDAEVTNLSESFDDNIKKDAQDLLNALQKAKQPNQNNVNGLKKLLTKIEGLSFISSKYDSLVEEIKDFLKTMPQSGRLDGSKEATLHSFLSDLTTDDGILNRIKSVQNNKPQEEAIALTTEAEEIITAEEEAELAYLEFEIEEAEAEITINAEAETEAVDFDFDFDQSQKDDFYF